MHKSLSRESPAPKHQCIQPSSGLSGGQRPWLLGMPCKGLHGLPGPIEGPDRGLQHRTPDPVTCGMAGALQKRCQRGSVLPPVEAVQQVCGVSSTLEPLPIHCHPQNGFQLHKTKRHLEHKTSFYKASFSMITKIDKATALMKQKTTDHYL